MSIAWTTIFVIVFLLPGILFHVGLYAWDRLPREIIRVGVVGEIAVAVFVSIAIHLLAWGLVGSPNVRALLTIAELETASRQDILSTLSEQAPSLAAYVLASGAFGFVAGLAIGWTGLFATHKWARGLRSPNLLVTVYVMTKTVIDEKVLMYRGGLTEFYLKPDGSLAYLVLNDARKFHMSATDERWSMAAERSLLGEEATPEAKSWSFMAIDGANISNILFEKSPKLTITGSGADALNEALEELSKSLQRRGGRPDGDSGSSL